MTDDRFDLVAAWTVGLCIVAAACGSSIVLELFRIGRPARWLLLAALGVVALARAWRARRAWRVRPGPFALVALLCALSFVSAGWSSSVHNTLGRAAGETWVAASAILLAGCLPAAPRLAGRLADAVLAAAGTIAVGSLALLAVEAHGKRGAFQASTIQYPERFRGLEFNPNTLAMLLAVGMPFAIGVAADRGRRAAVRVTALALLVLFVAEIALTGSRGGLVAGFGAALVVAALLPETRRVRAAVVATTVVALVVAAGASTIPKALPSSAAQQAPVTATRGINGESVLPIESEVGNPWWTHKAGRIHRTLFSTSVRLRALKGAVQRGLERPLLGWGYGAETSAFINRYYGFDSQNPENGYVGIFLQLGVIGLLVLVCTLLMCVIAGVRAALRSPSAVSAGVIGAACAGILIGVSQSYFHGPGGIIFVAFWISLVLAGALSPARTRTAG